MASPVTVAANVIVNDILSVPDQRCVWYTKGHWWVAYRYGNANWIRRVHIRSSPDKVVWSAPMDAIADLQAIDVGGTVLMYSGSFGVALNEATGEIHVVFQCHLLSSERPAVYRMGQCNSDGTITWASVDVKRCVNTDAEAECLPKPVLDSDGYPWIMARRTDWGGIGGDYFSCPVIDRSTTKDGTWASAAGFPHELEAVVFNIDVSGSLCALPEGRMLAFWVRPGLAGYAKCKLWDGSAWEAEQDLGLVDMPSVSSPCCNVIRIGSSGGALMVWLDASAPAAKHAIRSCYRAPDGTLGAFKTVHNFTDVVANKAAALLQSPPMCIWGDNPAAGKLYGKFYDRVNDLWTTDPIVLLDVAEAGMIYDSVSPSLNTDKNGYLLIRWIVEPALMDVRFMESFVRMSPFLGNNNAKMRVMAQV